MLDDDCALGPQTLSALPVFPLPNAVLLPGTVLPLNVFEQRYLDLVDHVLENDHWIGVPLVRPQSHDSSGRPQIERVFGVGRLLSHQRLPDGRRFIRVEGVRRVRLVAELGQRSRFREVAVELLQEDSPTNLQQLEILKAQLERLIFMLRPDDRTLLQTVLRIPDPRILVYAVAAIVPTLDLLPELATDGPSFVLGLQQRCLEAENADERVADLLECAGTISGVLSDSGRFPRARLNLN